MGRVIRNPKVEIIDEGGVLRVGMRYGVGTEEYPDIRMRKDFQVPYASLTSQEKAKIDEIMAWATDKIEVEEVIN